MSDIRNAAINDVLPIMRGMTAPLGVKIAMSLAMALIVDLLLEDFEMEEATALRGAEAIAKDVVASIHERFAAKGRAN